MDGLGGLGQKCHIKLLSSQLCQNPDKSAFDSAHRTLVRNLTLLSPILREQQQKYFQGTEESGLGRVIGGAEKKHNTASQSNSKAEIQGGTHLSSGSPDALCCLGR